MPPAGVRLAIGVGALACLAALAVTVLVAGDVPGDRRALVEIHGWVGTSLDDPMRAVGDVTDTAYLALAATMVAVGLALQRRWRGAVVVAATFGIVVLVNPLLKVLVGRERPDVRPLPEPVSEFGFPSGHASGTAALVGGLWLASPTRPWPSRRGDRRDRGGRARRRVAGAPVGALPRRRGRRMAGRSGRHSRDGGAR